MASAAAPTAVNTQEYAGDEVNAIILDTGSHSTRAGFSGEDLPKSICPTHFGVLSDGTTKVFGENAIHNAKPGMEIKNPFDKDGIVEDWETATQLWQYAITSRLTGAKQTPPSKNGLNDGNVDEGGDTEMNVEEAAEKAETGDVEKDLLGEYPLLVTEAAWNPAKAREKTMEIAMEEWGVPAFFLAKTGQLAAYAQGKATALVVDIGHQNTSITAIWEGMVLKKSIHRTPLAGSYLNSQLRSMFSTLPNGPAPLTPHFMIKSKSPVDANAPSAATYKTFTTPPTDSYRALEEDRVLLAFKESLCTTWPGPNRLESSAGGQNGTYTNADVARQQPAKPFEFPCGWNTIFGLERYKVVEGLFDHAAAYPTPSFSPTPDQTLTSICKKALDAVDVDSRPHLMNNIIVTGAGSLIEKLPERLQSDLQAIFPNPKVRVLASGVSTERKFGAWIGGSVLGSLGTFHQMWVSRGEYEEFGKGVVEKRCK